MPALSFDDLDEPRLKAAESAVRGEERGGPGVVSPQGAEGVGQITPGTFKQYAYPGEHIGNSDDNVAVSNRIIRNAYGKYGGDVGRVATDYFSGSGNVAPSGSTPWKQNRRDVNEPVSAYVANVEKRMPKQQPLDFSDLDGPKKGPLDFSDLEKPWRVPPANEGPRENINLSPQTDLPQRPPGPIDPRVIALQKIQQRLAMNQALGSWMKQKAEVGYDWVKNLPPDLISNAIDQTMAFGANKATDALTELFRRAGSENPETQAHGAMDLIMNGPMAMIGTGVKFPESGKVDHLGPAPAIEGVPKEDPASAGIPSIPGEPVRGEGPTMRDSQPASVGAAAVPTHEILAESIKAKEATLAATDPTFRQNMRKAANDVKAWWAPETARNIETGEQGGLQAAAQIRKAEGGMEQVRQQAAAGLNKFYKMFNGVTAEEGLTVLKWLQDPASRGAGGYEPTPEVSSFMDTFAKQMQRVQSILASTDKTADMNFRENFVTGLWQNPKTVALNLGKGGSNYFTKAKVWESYDEGIRAGGIPLTTNPLEIGLRYIDNATHAITQNQIIEAGEDSGDIVFRNPAEGNIPGQGSWVPLKGRAESYRPGQVAYASPEYAQVYNNYVAAKTPPGGDLLSRFQTVSNATTMTQLALSGFHAMLSIKESIASGLADAIDNIAGGHPLVGAAKAVGALARPITSIPRARMAINAYLDESGIAGGPKTQRAVKAMVDANFRVMGKGRITDEYQTSFLPDFFESIRKGRLKLEATQATADIAKHPVVGTARQVANLVFRSLDTLATPTFKFYVPHLKVAAGLDMITTYMRNNPLATDEELAAFARQASNTIDDRFGEMNHDNIFLKNVQKRWMQALLVSSSYAYGTGRAAAGAIGDAGRFVAGRGGWTPRMSYPIAAFGATAIVNSIYQYLKTGKLPSSMQDITNPQTGGVDPKTGQPARATLPDQMNQFFALYWNHDPGHQMYDKLNGTVKLAWDLVSMLGPTGGANYKGDPLINKNDPVVQQMEQAGRYAMESFMPFSVMNMQSQPGSALSGPERFMGVKDAPRARVDPEGSAEALRYVNADKAVTKKQHDGELPRYLPHDMKRKLIQQELNRYRGPQ
jgi:hypothetical protein